MSLARRVAKLRREKGQSLQDVADAVEVSKAHIWELEKGRAETGGLAAGLGELPLFAAALDAAEEKVDRLREKLDGLDLDALSPREALDLLYELKREAGTEP